MLSETVESVQTRAPKERPPPPPMLKPVPGAEDRFYFEGWERRQLLVQRCRACGQLRHPPRPWCPSCRDPLWDPLEVSGLGEVYSFVIPRKPSPAAMLPFPIVALVALTEGVRMVANLVGIEPEDVRIGLRVQLEFAETGDGFLLPLFRPQVEPTSP